MSITQDSLVRAIETSFFAYPEIPGKLSALPIRGVRGRVTGLSHPLLNLVGAASLDESNADATIREVHAFFESRQKAYGWVTGPSSTPADLAARLSRSGLPKVEEMAGMALTDLSLPVGSNPAVTVREVTPDDFRAQSDMLARAYGLPQDVAQFLGEMLANIGDALKFRAYFAYELGEPVAFSTLLYLPDSPVVLLGGAGTLPNSRGHGIYSSMVARRLADARADGAQAAIIQAVRGTSAPICAGLGFQEISTLELFAWIPGETEHSHLV